jgi:hypothetical protein
MALIWINRIILILLLILSLCTIPGKLVFGHGLGDIVYYIFLWLVTICCFIFYLRNSRKDSKQGFVVSACIFAFLLIFILYSMTIGRGGEYRWNGNVFY